MGFFLTKKIETNQSFYNSIATVYESQLNENDAKARAAIAKLFLSRVKGTKVLDFGGGTGLDLGWLSDKMEKVFFLEPSAGMREVAYKTYRSTPNITFLDSNLEFERWSISNLPFDERVDGVLANFAVLNSFDNLPGFFKSLSLLCKRQCVIGLTLINPQFKAMLLNYSLLQALKLILGGKVVVLNRHKDKFHQTFLHTTNSIRLAAESEFFFDSISQIPNSNFLFILLIKK